MKGYFSLLLHAHLPFVRHPEYNDFLEEDWLYEALTESYLPLVHVFDGLIKDNISFNLTMTLSPSLCAMLEDDLLMSRYSKYLSKMLELSEKELVRTKTLPLQNETAKMYNDKLSLYQGIFENQYKRGILAAFKKFQDRGYLEIITCAATHAFLPFIKYEKAIDAQIKIAKQEYQRVFKREASGIWLPECAYKEGLDEILKNNGIKYFFTETHGVSSADPQPKNNVYAPIICPKSEVIVFARDVETSEQVWSKENGYPGDFRYREFYRDLGYDADYEYIKPYLHSDGVSRNIGFKYHRITGRCDLSEKEYYSPQEAVTLAACHADNFIEYRKKQVEHLAGTLGQKPLVLANYDAELFGHWWFEGPVFLDFLFRKIYAEQDVFELVTLSKYLEFEKNTKFEIAQPADSSWGAYGYYDIWLNKTNDWIYKHLHKCEEIMIDIAKNYNDSAGLTKRALNQAARELLLAQASDWAFIMKTGTMVEYAHKRTKDHILRFLKLYESIESDCIDEETLSDYEKKDNIFPNLSYQLYS
ncbi:MAG: DUF1957 domain-containing protein [bacterium]|nr:DUF1957 domain-containing protein [bacterium]